MLLQITNTCRMGCKHCMEDSKPEPMFMTDDMVDSSFEFIKKCNVHSLIISGGEPTEHPKFFEIVNRAAKTFPVITVCSNGMFIFDKDKCDKFKRLMDMNLNIFLQVYTNKKYYPLYDEIMSHKDDFLGLAWGNKVAFQPNYTIFMRGLGRAATNQECLEEARKHKYSTSCMTAASICYQIPFVMAVQMLESRFHYCSPMIDWQGNIHLSESWLCPNIGNVKTFDKFEEVVKFKPCGKCADYQKIIASTQPNYIQIKELMGL